MSIITDINSQFLAPPVAAEETPVPRASNCGEVAMYRLRHPFSVADVTARRTRTEPAAH